MTHSRLTIAPSLGLAAASLALVAAVLFVAGAPELGLVALVGFLVVGGTAAFDAILGRERTPSPDAVRSRIDLDPEDVPRDYVVEEPLEEEAPQQAS